MTATAVAPMQHVGLEQVAQGVREVVERADEVRRHEAQDEVGFLAAERLEDLAGGLTHRVRGNRMLRQRRRVLRHRGMVRGGPPIETVPRVTGAARGLAGRSRQSRGRHPPLSEADSAQLVARHGVPMAESRRVGSADEAVAAAEQVGYPVVVKLNGARIAHKTERGLVRLGLADPAAVRDASAAAARGGRVPTTATSISSSRTW